MEPIATTLLASNAASVTFSSIPQNYKHLQLRILGRCAGAFATGTSAKAEYNGDTTTTNYYSHYLQGDGASATAGSNASGIYFTYSLDNSNTANVFSGNVVDILDYANGNKFKTSRNLSGYDLNGTGRIFLSSSLWMNTAPITSIVITATDGSWLAASRFSLFGVKG
jgi:hypothetical protein